MKQRTSRVLSSEGHLRLWLDLEQREGTPELDLGLVDAIQNGVWNRCDDVGRLIATSSELLLDERFDANALPTP